MLRKVLPLLLSTLLNNFLLSQTSIPPAVGDGSSSNPYQIASLENLYWLAANSSEWSKHFVQTANINASSTKICFPNGSGGFYGWTPIGNSGTKSYRHL